MQKIVINFVVVVVAVFVGLMLYDRFGRGHLTAPTVVPAAPASDFGAGAIHDRASMLRSDFARAADPAKTAMAEYYANTGKWPDKNADAGLPSPEAYKGDSLRKLDVHDATITMTFDAQSGVEDGKLVMTGEPTPQLAMGIKWTCVSPNMSDIHNIIASCTYAP